MRKLLVKWKDKSESWIKLADMKESHPVEVAEYARANGNNLWKDALEMEMYNIDIAFEILEDGKIAPTGYT